MAKISALAKFTNQIKDADKADLSISNALRFYIEEYHKSGEFDEYLKEHAADAMLYLQPNHPKERKGMFRGSAAGKCVQQQAFKALEDRGTEVDKDTVDRPTTQTRALYNGTFGHVRWHMIFDALNEKGIVRTLAAEELRYYPAWELSGSIDRCIEFPYQGRTVRAVIDFKTMKNRYFSQLVAPLQEHIDQHHAYQKFDWGAERWIMMYECKDTHELKIYDGAYSEAVLGRLEHNYKSALEWVHTFEEMREPLPDIPLITDWCAWCPYNTVCKALHPDRGGR